MTTEEALYWKKYIDDVIVNKTLTILNEKYYSKDIINKIIDNNLQTINNNIQKSITQLLNSDVISKAKTSLQQDQLVGYAKTVDVATRQQGILAETAIQLNDLKDYVKKDEIAMLKSGIKAVDLETFVKRYMGTITEQQFLPQSMFRIFLEEFTKSVLLLELEKVTEKDIQTLFPSEDSNDSTLFSFTATSDTIAANTYEAVGGSAKCAKALKSDSVTIDGQNFYKFDSGSYYEFTFADGKTFEAGDVVELLLATESAKKEKGIILNNNIVLKSDFDAMVAKTLTYTVQEEDSIFGTSTIKLSRNDSDIRFGTITVKRTADEVSDDTSDSDDDKILTLVGLRIYDKILKEWIKSKSLNYLNYKFVETLPSTGEKGILYLVPNENNSKNNIKDEYIWIESDKQWECIGSTDINILDYYTKTEIDELFSSISPSDEIIYELEITGDEGDWQPINEGSQLDELKTEGMYKVYCRNWNNKYVYTGFLHVSNEHEGDRIYQTLVLYEPHLVVWERFLITGDPFHPWEKVVDLSSLVSKNELKTILENELKTILENELKTILENELKTINGRSLIGNGNVLVKELMYDDNNEAVKTEIDTFGKHITRFDGDDIIISRTSFNLLLDRINLLERYHSIDSSTFVENMNLYTGDFTGYQECYVKSTELLNAIYLGEIVCGMPYCVTLFNFSAQAENGMAIDRYNNACVIISNDISSTGKFELMDENWDSTVDINKTFIADGTGKTKVYLVLATKELVQTASRRNIEYPADITYVFNKLGLYFGRAENNTLIQTGGIDH